MEAALGAGALRLTNTPAPPLAVVPVRVTAISGVMSHPDISAEMSGCDITPEIAVTRTGTTANGGAGVLVSLSAPAPRAASTYRTGNTRRFS